MDNMDLSVTTDGKTKWNFLPNIEYPCSLVMKMIKGYLIISQKRFIVGDIIMKDFNFTSTISGLHRDRVCESCKSGPHQKIKIRSDCKSMIFCSEECMEVYNHAVDKYGIVLDLIHKHKDYNSLALVIKILYNRYSYGTQYIEKILKLELHLKFHNNVTSEITENAEYLFLILKQTNSSLLYTDDDVNLIKKLLLAIRYNMQSTPILNLPSTTIQALSLPFSRFNHSCCPNIQLLYRYDIDNNNNNKTPRLCLCAIAIKDIEIGDELGITYLSDLCLDFNKRQILLHESFHFQCNCQRCNIEKNSAIELNNNNNYNISNDDELQLRLHLNYKSNDNRNYIDNIITKIEKRILSYKYNNNNNNPVQSFVYSDYNTCLSCIMKLMEYIRINNKSKDICKEDNDTTSYTHICIHILELIIRICNICAKCWDVIGCQYLMIKVNYLLLGTTMGMKLKSLNSNSTSFKTKKIISIAIKLAEEAINILFTPVTIL